MADIDNVKAFHLKMGGRLVNDPDDLDGLVIM